MKTAGDETGHKMGTNPHCGTEEELDAKAQAAELNPVDWLGLSDISASGKWARPFPGGSHNRTLKWLLLALVATILLAWWVLANRNLSGGNGHNSPSEFPGPANLPSGFVESQGTGKIVVDVHGDVVHPGIYELPANARVQDAVRAAGGFVHPGDAQLVNGAAPLDDGQEVMVPQAAAAGSLAPGVAGAGTITDDGSTTRSAITGTAPLSLQGGLLAKGSARLDLNTADAASLESLPGIGPARAAAIVQYRIEHGGFRAVEEMPNVPGIGTKIMEKVKPYLVVGPTSDGQKP